MPDLRLGRLTCCEKAGAAGNSTSPSLCLAASSAARCWRRRVRRLMVNSMLNFMLSTKRSSSLQTNSDTSCLNFSFYEAVGQKKNLTKNSFYFFVVKCSCKDLTLSWSRVWRCRAAHCVRSRGTSPSSLLKDRPAVYPRVAQTDGSQTHQVPDSLRCW